MVMNTGFIFGNHIKSDCPENIAEFSIKSMFWYTVAIYD